MLFDVDNCVGATLQRRHRRDVNRAVIRNVRFCSLSITECAAIFARIGTTTEHAARTVDLDRLSAAPRI